MKLKREEVVVNDEVFEVVEIAVGAMMPLLILIGSEDAEEAQRGQIEMLKVCIFHEGKALGDRISELGISTYLKLAEKVMAVNGMDMPGKEGKD